MSAGDISKEAQRRHGVKLFRSNGSIWPKCALEWRDEYYGPCGDFPEIMVTYAYKKFFKYLLPENLEPSSLVQLLSTDYKFAVSFTILVIVLLIRPSGIFRGKVL